MFLCQVLMTKNRCSESTKKTQTDNGSSKYMLYYTNFLTPREVPYQALKHFGFLLKYPVN